jgi:hypothetical protein
VQRLATITGGYIMSKSKQAPRQLQQYSGCKYMACLTVVQILGSDQVFDLIADNVASAGSAKALIDSINTILIKYSSPFRLKDGAV